LYCRLEKPECQPEQGNDDDLLAGKIHCSNPPIPSLRYGDERHHDENDGNGDEKQRHGFRSVTTEFENLCTQVAHVVQYSIQRLSIWKSRFLKIQSLQTYIVGNPPPHFGGRYFIFLKLTTDTGIEGVGEVYTATFSPWVVKSMIEDVFACHVQDSDPFHIERLWRRVYGRGYTLRPDVSLMSVLSGLEMACWDIVGKAVNKPVYELLGGKVHERLRSYTYIYPRPGEDLSVYSDPDLAAERALEYLDMGFTALKFDPAGPYTVYDGRQPSMEELERSERFVKTLRSAVGKRADLLFGTHGQFTAAGAIRLAQRLESSDPLWFEEPANHQI